MHNVQLHTHAFRENVGLTCRGIDPVYCKIHCYIHNTLLLLHWTEYCYSVQSNVTVNRVMLQCTEYYYSEQNSVTVYKVLLECTEYYYSVQSIVTVYRVVLQCTE